MLNESTIDHPDITDDREPLLQEDKCDLYGHEWVEYSDTVDGTVVEEDYCDRCGINFTDWKIGQDFIKQRKPF